MQQKIVADTFGFQHGRQALAKEVGGNPGKETGLHTEPAQAYCNVER